MRNGGATTITLETPPEAWAKNDCASQSHGTTNSMNYCRSGKIMETYTERGQEMPIATHGGEETVRPPGPVANDGIDKSRNHNAVKEVADEARAANHRARRNGRAGIGEGELKEPEGEKRNAGPFIGSRN